MITRRLDKKRNKNEDWGKWELPLAKNI